MNTTVLDVLHPFAKFQELVSLGQPLGIWLLCLGFFGVFLMKRSISSSVWLGFIGGLAPLAYIWSVGSKGAGSFWLLAALAGFGLLFWAILAPVFLRFANTFVLVLLLLWCVVFLADISLLCTSQLLSLLKGESGGRVYLQFGILAVLVYAILRDRVWKHGWFQWVLLTHFNTYLLISGISALAKGRLPSSVSDPIFFLTIFTVVLFVSYISGGSEEKGASVGILERYRPHSSTVLTHIFLICFTIVTIYPVLWVVRMATTPEQGFSMGLNPVPKPLLNYVEAWGKGEKKVAACYSRAMDQNFREVIGGGGVCGDQICQSYRLFKDESLQLDKGKGSSTSARNTSYKSRGDFYLQNQNTICSSFYKAWEHPKPKCVGKASKEKKKCEEILEKWSQERDKKVEAWQKSTLALSPSKAEGAELARVLNRIKEQQHKMDKMGPLFWRQFFNSVFVALITTLLGVFLACSAAYAFSRFEFTGRRTGLMSFLVSQMFPGTLMMIPLYILVGKLGLLNSLLGLTLVYSTTSIPFCVWMLKGYFDTIPKEIEEAALIDGASKTMIFWKIMLPLAKPAIAVTALFSFMAAWNEFILAATFMNEATAYTLPVMLKHFAGAHSTEWGRFAAGALIVSLPVVLLFFFLQKYLISGLTAGSVKG